MGRNIFQKIVESHRVSGNPTPGSEVGIRIDQTLIQDATGTMALLQFEALGMKRVKTGKAVAYVDHNTLQGGFESMDDHLFVESACRKFGLYFSRAGNGICHQVHLENFSAPGGALLGADSHTTTSGGVGMLAIGAGGLDVAVAMAGEPFYFTMPRVLNIKLEGRLPAWSTAKDVVLEILRRLTVSGGRGKVLEFSGPGVQTLSATGRATITNMSIETGALTAVFPSDRATLAYFRSMGRESDWRELQADPDAGYEEAMVVDLGSVEPMIAKPHSPDNVAPVRELAGEKVDQVAIGSCTNSSLEDMLKVAAILNGKVIPPGMSLVIAPGSRRVLRQLADGGQLGSLIAAGARILECACGPCIGMGQAPRSGGASLRTFNRNFRGRSGTADAKVYLTSPETAAASALQGRITDPRELGEPLRIRLPEATVTGDRMILSPAAEEEQVAIARGPNIKPLPRFEPLPDVLEAEVLLVAGDNVTTDEIMPGGAKILPLRSNIPAISRYAFSRIDPDFAARAEAAGQGFVLGGKNYGQGSSREHAALAPRYLGVRAVIAQSFSRIHKANLINFGILPLEFAEEADLLRFAVGDRLRLDQLHRSLQPGGNLMMENLSRNFAVPLKIDLSPRARKILLAGGLLALIGAGCKDK